MKSLRDLNVYSTSSVAFTDQTLGAGQVLPNRYQINGLLDTGKPVLENIEKICSAAASWLSYDSHEGKWGVVINQSSTSVVSFNDSNIIGNISVSGTGLQDLYNSVKVEFPHRELRDSADFISVEIPDSDRNANEEDNALNISYDIINDPVQANLLGFIELKQSRVDLVIRFVTDFSYINLKAGDVIDVTDSRFSFTNKKFRIITITEIQEDDGALMMEITALEYSDNVYDTSDLYKYTRTDENGIITIGSIGVPGTPQVTKYEIDSRPRIIIETTVPSGVVDGMEFWLSTDTALPDDQRSYVLIGVKRPDPGGVYSSGEEVDLDYDNVSSSTFAIKTRGFNATTVGPFSDPSGLIAFTSTQVTQAIGPDTGVIDALGNLGTILGAYTLLKGVDELYQKIANTGSLFTKIFEAFEDLTGVDLIGDAEAGTLGGLGVAKDGTLITNSATSLNFVGDAVELVDNGGGNISIEIATTASGVRGYTGSAGDVGYTGSAGSSGANGYVGSAGLTNLGSYQDPLLALPSVFTIGTTYPPDRSIYTDPTTGATSDTAPITGPFSIAFNTTLALPLIYNIILVPGKNIYLYKSNGTLVETISSDNCELYTYNWGNYFNEIPNLQTNQASIRFTFNNRELGTDYYILMDEGILEYCNVLKSPGIISPDIWNFNTAPYPTNPYSVWASSTVGVLGYVTGLVSSVTPQNTAICSGVAPQLTLSWNRDRIATATTSSVTLRLYDVNFPSTIIQTVVTTGQLINPRTMKVNSTALTSLIPGKTYTITVPKVTGLRTSLEAINCGYQYSAADFGSNQANNLTIESASALQYSSFNVKPNSVNADKNTNIEILFNRFVRLGNSGNFNIREADGTIHQTISVSSRFDTDKSSELVVASTITNTTIILNPTLDFKDGTTYYVTADAGTVLDACGNSWTGTNSTSTIRFNIVPAPTSTATYSSENIILNYGQLMSKNFGAIACTGTFIVKNSGGSTVISMVASNSNVTISGNTATVSLSSSWNTLSTGTYFIDINKGFLAAASGNRTLCSQQINAVSFTK